MRPGSSGCPRVGMSSPLGADLSQRTQRRAGPPLRLSNNLLEGKLRVRAASSLRSVRDAQRILSPVKLLLHLDRAFVCALDASDLGLGSHAPEVGALLLPAFEQ